MKIRVVYLEREKRRKKTNVYMVMFRMKSDGETDQLAFSNAFLILSKSGTLLASAKTSAYLIIPC